MWCMTFRICVVKKIFLAIFENLNIFHHKKAHKLNKALDNDMQIQWIHFIYGIIHHNTKSKITIMNFQLDLTLIFLLLKM